MLLPTFVLLVCPLTGGGFCCVLSVLEELLCCASAGTIIAAEGPVPLLQLDDTSLTLCRIRMSFPVPELMSVELLIALASEFCERASVPVIETVCPILLASCDTSEPITLYCFGIEPPVEIK